MVGEFIKVPLAALAYGKKRVYTLFHSNMYLKHPIRTHLGHTVSSTKEAQGSEPRGRRGPWYTCALLTGQATDLSLSLLAASYKPGKTISYAVYSICKHEANQ